VLTPHAGEMAGLLGVARDDVVADPVRIARDVAVGLHTVVVLKGGRTVIAAPDGRAWGYHGGGIGLATSGSGDTLAGITAGLLARGAAPETAVLWAVHLHGEAGKRLARTQGRLGFLARELLAEVPAIMAGLELQIG
jgi:NAD(P)H-hydrate repair Nnr-like enzyme with NAD(P)H-hydrate dehydratase domain